MRYTLVIADDVVTAAKGRVVRQNVKLGKVTSSVGELASGSAVVPDLSHNGITSLLVGASALAVTPELVKQLGDEQA